MKLKLLVAAMTLATSAQVSASIMGPVNGAGETMFSVWDPTTNNSYTQDLGVSFTEFLANLSNPAYSRSFTLDSAVYTAALGGSSSSNLIWNVSVGESLALDYSNYESYGIIGSSQNAFQLNYSALDQAIAKHDQYATAVNGVNPADTNPADNNAYHGTIANGAYAGSTLIWGTNWGGAPVNNTAPIGTDMGFYYQQADFLGGGDAIVTQALGTWSFDGSTLTYGASVVPVPAAIWLMGSGLLGLVGVARRKDHGK